MTAESVSADIDLTVNAGGLALQTPVMGASGCCGFGHELLRLGRAGDVSALVTPSLTARTQSSDHRGVLLEVPSGLVSPTDRPSLGTGQLEATRLPWDADGIPPVIVSLAGNLSGAYAEAADQLRRQSLMRRVAGVEVNLACGDRKNDDRPFAHDVFGATKVIARVREQLPRDLPLFAKLSADVHDLVEIARGCVKSGATGLVVSSPLRALSIDLPTLRPRLTPAVTGLSGPAILPITLRAVWELRAAVLSGRLPNVAVVAVGGIARASDAVQALAAGASAVQVGSVMLHDPSSAERVTTGLLAECERLGIPSVKDLIGRAHHD
ncbi:dihydroorotate dehydrogenase [Flexivirga meconopsidis]|uniref:dihydroorotate dehydrogenase n=1 Tax=Flexivirga meconopsidis TaxID=2977121 RepID=UPI002240BC29